jgi:phosphate transport system substrate-binding protein
MMKKKISYFFVLGFIITILACNQNSEPNNEDQSMISGKTKMLADESLFPIVDDEYQIFSNIYKQSNIELIYKPQSELLPLFLNDSIDVAFMARTLTKNEAKYYEDRKIVIKTTKFAIDGIALITGQQNQDSTLSVEDLKQALLGKSKKSINFVFDNPKSSTVEYLMNLAGVKKFPDNIYALASNKEVIAYIKKHPQAVGIVSVAWMQRPTPDIKEDVESLKIMSVSATPNGEFFKPSQSNLKLGKYPLTRGLYLINCQGSAGLGTGFAAFLSGDVGQRIILKSGLAPDSLPSRQIMFRN